MKTLFSVTDKQTSILQNPSPQIPHIRPGREMPVFLLGSPELYKICISTYNSIYSKGLRGLLRLHDCPQMVGAVSMIDGLQTLPFDSTAHEPAPSGKWLAVDKHADLYAPGVMPGCLRWDLEHGCSAICCLSAGVLGISVFNT